MVLGTESSINIQISRNSNVSINMIPEGSIRANVIIDINIIQRIKVHAVLVLNWIDREPCNNLEPSCQLQYYLQTIISVCSSS